MVSLNISENWYHAPNGRIAESTPNDAYVGGHTVLFHGYDDLRQEFSFRNSWGVNWGDKGNGCIPYTVFEASWVEGWCSVLAAKPMDENPKSGVVERRWGVREHGSGVLHCYEFVDSKAGKIGWMFFVERSGLVEVEELFIMPAFRNRGYAAKLMKLLSDHASERGTSLKLWISHADTAPENVLIIEKLASRLGLGLSSSPVRWTSYLVTTTTEATDLGATVISSPRAARPSALHIASAGNSVT